MHTDQPPDGSYRYYGHEHSNKDSTQAHIGTTNVDRKRRKTGGYQSLPIGARGVECFLERTIEDDVLPRSKAGTKIATLGEPSE